jgi:hypothetical protein
VPQAKTKPEAKEAPVIQVVLPTAVAKKHSVRFETEEKGAQVTNIYLGLDGCRKLGNPDQVEITIRAHTPES